MVVLLFVVTLGFSFSMVVLLRCELGETAFPEWQHPGLALFTVVNMGSGRAGLGLRD